MDSRELREQCLARPGAVEEFPFGDEVSVGDLLGDSYELVVASLPKARRPG